MPIDVFPWPPVGVVASEWTTEQPVSRMRSALTGRDVLQSSRRARRLSRLTVSALAAGRMGAGYCEMLKQLLAGGVHGVRILSSPINWHLDELARQSALLNSAPIDWIVPPQPLAWQAGTQELVWLDGGVILAGQIASAGGGAWTLKLSGLPAGTVVARPGDFVRLYDIDDAAVWQVLRVLRPAISNQAGNVTLKVDREPAITGGRVNLAGQDEAVFRVDGPLPRAMQPVGQDWSYDWSFREVFADEVGGFNERATIWN